MSKGRTAYTEKEITDKDILYAWCYSDKTWDYSFREIIECLGLVAGYPSKMVPNTKYVEFAGLKDEIRKTLDSSSFCYVKGIGGLGKSRIALKIEEDIGSCIKDETWNNLYLDAIFISLKPGPAKEEFLSHVKEKVSEKNNDVALKKYFHLLGNLAKSRNKKIFVVIDNIDSDEDFRTLNTFYNCLKEFHHPGKDSTIQLLVTGRRDLSEFLKDNDLMKVEKGPVIEIKKYCNDPQNIWNLFSTNFLAVNGNPQGRAKDYIEANKEFLLGVFKKYDNHPGFTVIWARIMGQSFIFKGGEIGKDIHSISDRLDNILGNEFQLDDYGRLSEVAKVPLETLDEKFKGRASKIFQIFSLIRERISTGRLWQTI